MAKKTTKRTTRAKSKQTATTEYKLPDGMALGLRSCKPDFTSPAAEANGFRWPRSGYVEAPDWIADKHCGHGLHLLAHGEGNGELICLQDGDPWLVCEYDPKLAVDLSGKIKVKECTVVFCGDRSSAPLWIMAHDPLARSVVSGTATAGYRGTATAGYRGTATAGYSGTATAGDRGTATAGDSGTATAGFSGTATAGDGGAATAGDSGTATAGYRGTATAGFSGTATAGDGGAATAGFRGTATAGDSGTATAGYSGTATAGDSGTATAGDGGTATAGDSGTATAGYSGTARSGDIGIVVLRWYDYANNRHRLSVGYVGEDGIKPNTFYRCDDSGNLVKA